MARSTRQAIQVQRKNVSQKQEELPFCSAIVVIQKKFNGSASTFIERCTTWNY